MRINVGLPGPVSVSGNVPSGCMAPVLLVGALLTLLCFGSAIVKTIF